MKSKAKTRCTCCGRDTSRTGLITCDPCEAHRLKGLLASSAWLKVRGAMPGDLPGETLTQTMRRELQNLQVEVQR